MLEFLDKEAIDIILSAEVIFSIVFTVSLFIIVHSLLGFLRQSGGLYTRLAEIEAEMSVLQASIPVKLERIRTIRRSMEPLQQDFRKVQAYHAHLIHLERKWEKDAQQQEEEEEEEQGKKITRRRLGLDRFI
ncbi:hypothetical protein ACFL6X_07455 [Candidatus Latescibacterota bacterium]